VTIKARGGKVNYMTADDKFLNSLSRKLQRKSIDKDTVSEVYGRLEREINNKRPKPEDFSEFVEVKKINVDITAVEKLEQKWASESSQSAIELKKISDITEYIIYKNLSTWVDNKATALLTAKADDYLRGIDLVIESNQEPTVKNPDIEHFGVGIDVALVSKDHYSSSFESKKAKMKRMLETGKLTEARYVSGGHFKGSISELPYIILSIQSSHVNDLLEASASKTSTQKEKNHILKYIVAYQILRQLGTYYRVSNNVRQEHAAYQYGVANNFATNIFDNLIQEIENSDELWQKVSQDIGVIDIERLCDQIEKDLT